MSGRNRDDLLKRYAQAIDLWARRFDTAEIAEILTIDEAVVARWVANFREQTRVLA